MSGTQPTLTEPVDAGERIALLDILRGFAVFGLVLVKAADFSPDFWIEWPSALDRRISWIEERFLAERFFTLFAFLFGVGFAMQMERVAARGASFARFYVRRSLVLLAIGLVHGLLIWSGDILAGYAVVSFALLLFRSASSRTILASAAVIWMIGHAVWYIRRVLQVAPPVRPDADVVTALLSSGPPIEIWRHEAAETLFYLERALLGPGAWAYGVLTLFLLGLYAARRGVVRRLARDASFCIRVLLIAVIVAAVAWPAHAALSELWPRTGFPLIRRVALSAIGQAEIWAMAAAYASLLALVAMRRGWQTRFSPLAAVGRSALSNYLLQSVVFVLLYYNYGLGLYGRVRPSEAMLISIAVFAGELVLSSWWLRRYRFGPVEWLWRSLTYGRRQPMRRVADVTVVAGAAVR